jgi:glycosyltransferase involved in cell wall biosynthesis
MNNADTVRIAWLLPSTWFYWQPVLSKLTSIFPQTKLFTACWTGYAKGFEETFSVQEVGQKKFITTAQTSTGYGHGFTYLSLGIVHHLFQYKPHVVFSNSFGIWTVLALLFKAFGKWRVVIAYEGSSPNVDYRNSAIRLWIRRTMVRSADAFITNSVAGKVYLVEVLKAKQGQVFAQPYEVPVSEALIEQTPSTELNELDLTRPIFLYVGKIVPRKGLHLLLKACVALKEQGYRDFTVMLIGSGDQREELEKFCQTHQLQDCVKWMGRIEYHCLGKYFRQADAFILPTLEDTWGMVVLEAMLFAKPILCSKWAGAADMVVNGENGYIFDPHEPSQIADAMRRLLDDPDLASKMGQKSQEIIAHYTPDAAAAILAKITSIVVSNGREN